MDDVRIRRATREDAAEMAAIYNQAVANTTATFDTAPERPEDRAAWLDEHCAPQHPVLVAERDGRVVGWASLSRYSTRCAYEATVEVSAYIDENEQGRGLGRLHNKRVLLVDDVYTSGATVTECARTLVQAGAQAVDVFTLARAVS